MEQGVIGEVTELVKLAQLSQRIVKAPAEPPHIYYVAEDGERGITLRKETAASPAFRERSSDVATLVEWLKEQAPTKGEVWYSRRAVIAGQATASPQADLCTLSLSGSPQLSYLIGVEKSPATLDQSQLIRTLRTTLFGSHGGDLLANIRKVNLSKAKNVEAQQTKGKVSLNRSDIAEMSGAADIPDVVQFDVPVFSAASIPCRAVVQCDLDLNAETERFILTVLPGEIEKAWAKGEAWLLNEITNHVGKDDIAVYYGEPGCA